MSRNSLQAGGGLTGERGVKTHCDLCRGEYGIFNQEHICKRCTRSACLECFPVKATIYHPDRTNSVHKLCKSCYDEEVKVTKYITDHRLSFGKTSELGERWSDLLPHQKRIRVSEIKRQNKSFVQLGTLWKDLNCSFRHFVCRLLTKDEVSDQKLKDILGGGLAEISRSFKNDMHSGLYILLYFLCHCSLELAINLTMFVLELTQGASLQKEWLSSITRKVGFRETDNFRVCQFITQNKPTLTETVSINVLSIVPTCQIVELVLQNRQVHFVWVGTLLALHERQKMTPLEGKRHNRVISELARFSHIPNIQQYTEEKTEEINYKHKYSQLMKKHGDLWDKNQQMEKQLNLIKSTQDRSNKFLDDVDLSDQLDLTMTRSRKQAKIKEYETIIQQKQYEIAALKLSNQQLTASLAYSQHEQQKLRVTNERKNDDLLCKEEQIVQLRRDKATQLKANQALMAKLHELSLLLMDQEESTLKKDLETFQVRIKAAQTTQEGSQSKS